MISIHAPLAGCDLELVKPVGFHTISIHAPLAGCDAITMSFHSISLHFNPRTPCGVRRSSSRAYSPETYFNPRTPCGVRRLKCDGSTVTFEFQSTHPLRGATFLRTCVMMHDKFQSTHPLRGATRLVISLLRTLRFQSTHPLRGATAKVVYQGGEAYISIHAPLAGCDSKIAEIFPANLRKSYKISAKPNKERRCRVLGKGKAAAISGLARCEPPGENRNASGSHQIMSAPSGA